MSSILTLATPFLALLLTTPTNALPISNLVRRASSGMSTGAKAGLGIGIAVAAILLILVSVLFAIHLRRKQRNSNLDRERAILAGEKNADGSDKVDKFAEQPTTNLRRNKSVKDRLMGPLYRDNTIELPQRAAHRDSNLSEMHWDQQDGQPILHKPWASSSPRPSFSSKRATRMMMMM
jgi:hypothetical protein